MNKCTQFHDRADTLIKKRVELEGTKNLFQLTGDDFPNNQYLLITAKGEEDPVLNIPQLDGLTLGIENVGTADITVNIAEVNTTLGTGNYVVFKYELDKLMIMSTNITFET